MGVIHTPETCERTGRCRLLLGSGESFSVFVEGAAGVRRRLLVKADDGQ